MRISLGGLLVGLALAGCGSSSAPSSLEPTPLAPGKSALYLDFAVRPQGSLHNSAEAALTRLIGHSPDARLQRAVGKLLRRAHLSWSSDVRPWLGEHVGLVATDFSPSGLALIAPTNDPSAALAAMRKAAGNAHTVPTSYGGIHFQQGASSRPVAFGLIGRDAVIGGPAAFRAIVDAYHGNSIARNPGFVSAFGSLPGNSLVKGYVNGRSIGAALRTVATAFPVPSGSSLSPGASLQLFGLLRRKLAGDYGFAIAVGPRSFTIEAHSSPARPSHAGDVSNLPGQSWLALSTGGLSGRPSQGLLGAQLVRSPAIAQGLALLRQRTGIDVVHDVLPALGPVSLSIQGTAPAVLAGGLTLRPADPAAATRLLSSIFHLASRSHSLSVSGRPGAFLITKAGLPIPRVAVAELAQRVIITVDENFDQLLAPKSPLSASSAFTAARSSLTPGSRVSFYIDFQTLASLLQSIPAFNSGRNHKLLGVVQRLGYLVAGSSPSGGETQLVLGLR